MIILLLHILVGISYKWWWFLLSISYQVAHDFIMHHYDVVHFDHLIKVKSALLILLGLWLGILELAVSLSNSPSPSALGSDILCQTVPFTLLWLKSPVLGCSPAPSLPWMPYSFHWGSKSSLPPHSHLSMESSLP